MPRISTESNAPVLERWDAGLLLRAAFESVFFLPGQKEILFPTGQKGKHLRPGRPWPALGGWPASLQIPENNTILIKCFLPVPDRAKKNTCPGRSQNGQFQGRPAWPGRARGPYSTLGPPKTLARTHFCDLVPKNHA